MPDDYAATSCASNGERFVDGRESVVARSEKVIPSFRWALFSLSLSMLLPSLSTSIANVGLPTLAQAFHARFQDVQWIVIAYLLATTTLIVSVGRVGDVVGHRRLLLTGLVLFTAASAACGSASVLWVVVAARAVQGFGAAILMALTMAMVREAVPKERIGRAMGLLGTMSALGTALGPSLGGVLIGIAGWRAIFLINLPLGLIALYLASRFLPKDYRIPTPRRVRFDGVGTLLLASTLATYVVAVTMGHGRFELLNTVLLLASAFGFGAFAFAESRVASPLVPLETFRNPTLSTGFATSLLVTTVMMTTLVVGPFYLSGAQALDAARVGFVMSVGPIVAALTGVPAGRIVDRFGPCLLIVVGLAGMAVGCAALGFTSTALGVFGYVAPLVVISAGYALFQAANNTSVMSDVTEDQRGAISGMLQLSRNLGLITGASVMGAVFVHASGAFDITSAHPAEVTHGMRITFGVATALMFVALAVAIGYCTRVGEIFRPGMES